MKKIILFLCVGLLSFTSCNDWLDVKPKTEKESDELFETASGFKDALMACYIDLNSSNLFGKRLVATDIEYLAQHWDFGSGNNEGVMLLKDFAYKSSYAENTFKSIYERLYNVVVQANCILEYWENQGNVIQDSTLRNVIKGEALAIRAFCHMEVLRLYGQIPQNATITVKLPYAKAVSFNAPEFYDFDGFVECVLNDLEMAAELFKKYDPVLKYGFSMLDNFNANLVKDVFLNCRRFRFNYYAVQALKARLFLYLGKTEEAYENARKVIDAKLGEYPILSLAGNNDLDQSNFALPSECVLALSNSKIEQNLDIFDGDGHYLTQKHYEDLFAGQSVSVNNRALKLWDREATNNAGERIARFVKYKQPEVSSSNEELGLSKQVVPLIRLSELYLIAMETAPTLDEANRLYIEYMRARNVVAEELVESKRQETILMEYQREFYGEGQMFYVYKRLGSKEMKWKTDREVVEQDYIVPLPATELKKNN